MMPKSLIRRSTPAARSTWCDIDSAVVEGLRVWIQLTAFDAGTSIALVQLCTESLTAPDEAGFFGRKMHSRLYGAGKTRPLRGHFNADASSKSRGYDSAQSDKDPCSLVVCETACNEGVLLRPMASGPIYRARPQRNNKFNLGNGSVSAFCSKRKSLNYADATPWSRDIGHTR
ncbi:hypothetical protein CCUS01_13425 [Colletotrichum cuscutae]|uniref:Uncharacterized protein n=1 Tax=Colletotrichum cuscutae TaxID=1209917 RepID=A0AAJ0DNS0_9PEZI|nr:hypothetical protein CCUS01_13425 [Colletotrichum cuscutae]